MSNPTPPGTPEIAQVIKDVTTPQTPIEISLETGQVYKANTPQEALEKLAAAQTEATKAIRLRESENADLRQKITQLEQRIPKEQPSQNDEVLASFYQKWAQKPDDANLESLARKMGMTAEELLPALQETIASTRSRTAADEFVNRYPAFDGSPQNVTMLRDRVQQKFGQTMKAATADNLELAYQSLVREGKINPGSQPISGVSDQTIPIPNLRGGSAPSNPELELMQQARTMPLEQLAEVVRRLGQTTGRR